MFYKLGMLFSPGCIFSIIVSNPLLVPLEYILAAEYGGYHPPCPATRDPMLNKRLSMRLDMGSPPSPPP